MEQYVVLGYDDDGNEILGRSSRLSSRVSRVARTPLSRNMGLARMRTPSMVPVTRSPTMIASQPPMLQAVPGSPVTSVGGSAVNTPTVTFSSTTGTTLTATARPQKNFIGRRVIANIGRFDSALTAIPGNNVFLNDLKVGVDSQFVSPDPINLGALAVNATGAGFTINPTVPGLEYFASFSISGTALSATQTITVSLTIYGELIR